MYCLKQLVSKRTTYKHALLFFIQININMYIYNYIFNCIYIYTVKKNAKYGSVTCVYCVYIYIYTCMMEKKTQSCTH